MKPHVFTTQVCLACLPLCGACAVPGLSPIEPIYSEGWATAHADAANSDYSPVTGSPQLSLRWHRSFEGMINLGATSDAERVYVTTSGRGPRFYILDKRTGRTLWSTDQLDRAVVASSAVLDQDGRVFLADGRAMHAFDTAGRLLWRVPIVGFPLSAQFTRSGHLIYMTNIGRIYVLQRDTGAAVAETYELIPGANYDPDQDPRDTMRGTEGSPASNTLAIDRTTDRFYFTFWTPGKPAAGVRAMRFVEGASPAFEPLWTNDNLAEGSAASPDLSPDGARLYLTDNSGQLHALDTETGDIIWSYQLGYESGGSVSLSPEGVILPAGGGKSPLLAVRDAGDRAELLWQRSDFVNRGIPTQVAGDLAYAAVAARRGWGLELLVLDTVTGRELDRDPLPRGRFFTAGTTVGLDGTVYVATIDGHLLAYRSDTSSSQQHTPGE